MLAPGDDPSENFTPQRGNRLQNFSSANADSIPSSMERFAVHFENLLNRFIATTQGQSTFIQPQPQPVLPSPPVSSTSTDPLMSNTSSVQDPAVHHVPTTSLINRSAVPLPHILATDLAEKVEFPKLEDYDTFIDWRDDFLSIVCSCYLKHLYDRNIGDLILGSRPQDNVEVFNLYNEKLYSKITLALPKHNSFKRNKNYMLNGLALWHALNENNRASGIHNIQNLLSTFHSKSLMREPSESLDDYWNRFNDLVRQIQRCPGHESFSSASTIRRRFLTTLGQEFKKFADDDKNLCLDPTLLTINDETLISHLRSIQSNHAADSVHTISSAGYANALKASVHPSKTPTADTSTDAILALCLGIKESQASFMKQQAETNKELSRAIMSNHTGKPTGATTSKETTAATSKETIPQYCFTHGVCNHNGADCRQKRLNPLHTPDKDAATLTNRMGGSNHMQQNK